MREASLSLGSMIKLWCLFFFVFQHLLPILARTGAVVGGGDAGWRCGTLDGEYHNVILFTCSQV